jgi:predicted  nucleic acid-binding Zn-ribbon protein
MKYLYLVMILLLIIPKESIEATSVDDLIDDYENTQEEIESTTHDIEYYGQEIEKTNNEIYTNQEEIKKLEEKIKINEEKKDEMYLQAKASLEFMQHTIHVNPFLAIISNDTQQNIIQTLTYKQQTIQTK